MKSIVITFFLAMLTSPSAHAELIPGPWDFLNPLRTIFSTDEYRLGDEWGKIPINAQSLEKETPAFRRAALATAMMNRATGFYLGKFAGVHVLATNYHVCRSGWNCLGQKVTFPFLAKSFKAAKFLKSWPEVDLALLTLEVSNPADEELLAEVAGNFAFDMDLAPGQELLTIGFGIAGNPGRAVMAGQDRDCKIFSGLNEFRLIKDPDQLNPGGYSAWSFANGCDVSHGDSGSAMVDRHSGKVVGLIWTGKIPKKSAVQNSAYLDEVLRRGTEEAWTELSYAVPAAKIEETLRAAIKTERDELSRLVFTGLLAR